MMKNIVISQKAPFMKALRYIFLTVTTLCKARVDPGSRRVPRAPSNRQLIAHMDPRVPKIEAKLLAQQGVLVVLLPLNKRDLSLFMTGARLQRFILDQL